MASYTKLRDGGASESRASRALARPSRSRPKLARRRPRPSKPCYSPAPTSTAEELAACVLSSLMDRLVAHPGARGREERSTVRGGAPTNPHPPKPPYTCTQCGDDS